MFVASLLAGGGCARLVTVDPEMVPKLNDPGWKMRNVPAAPPSGSTTAAVQPIQPLPFRSRPEVAQALRSRPDSSGIPVDLYRVDPLLATQRKEIESQAGARHLAGGGTIFFGVAFGALGAWGISEGNEETKSSNPDTKTSGEQLTAESVILTAFAAGFIIAGIALLASGSPDDGQLRAYYRETYLDTR
jgi:hypothetical protein